MEKIIKLVPIKQIADDAKMAKIDQEFRTKARDMITGVTPYAELVPPDGYFDRHPGAESEMAAQFDMVREKPAAVAKPAESQQYNAPTSKK